jgi:murein DD-endopeptidase MepM/ murein hydrolase activator NlpD
MTSRRAGQQIGELSRRRSNPAPNRRSTRKTQPDRHANRRLAQLIACCTIFLLLVAAKFLLPERAAGIRERVSAALNKNLDVQEVFSAVGRVTSGKENVQDTLQDVYQAVFHPQESQAIETSAAIAESDFGEPDQLLLMRKFSEGTGTCDGWLSPQHTQTTAQEKPTEETTDAAAEQTTASSQSNQTETMQLSCVLYSDENLPNNVSMEQSVLGFDYCTPVMGTLSSGFGYREHPVEGEEKFHYGIDLAADTGTEIDCFADGCVTAVGESSSYGKYLIVAHDDDYSTLYAHCSKVCVSSGENVKENQKIAEVGETGMATGPHLHFEIHEGDEYINPVYYVDTSPV